MKKQIKYFLVVLTFLLLSISNVKAAVSAILDCGVPVIEGNYERAYEICTLSLKVEDNPTSKNTLIGTFKLTNVTLKKSDITLEKGWYIEDQGNNKYSFLSNATSFGVGEHKIATVKVYKVKIEEECLVKFVISNFTKIERKCTIFQNTYYGQNGNIVDKVTYEDECLDKPKSCVKEGSTYYGKSGTVVNQTQYQKECETHKCFRYADGTYSGLNGSPVEQHQYERECTEKHYCEKVDDKYYDKDGNVTNEKTYNYECFNHTCEVVDTGTIKGKVYFDKSGTESTKEKYEKDCFKHYCEVIDNTYFGKDGNTTNKKTYEKDCLKPTEYTCEKVGDDYYDLDGNKVSKEKYEESCTSQEKKCEIKDGKYYDKNGNEVKQSEYEKQCNKHSCEIIDDTYFDKNGNIVSKETYDKYCPIPENPSTGNFLPFIPLIILVIGGFGIYYYTRKTEKLV